MPISLRELADLAAKAAPPELAEPWDNVGLQVGDPDRRTRRVLVALDPSSETLDEAERLGAQAIVSHHPLILPPIGAVAAEGRVGRTLFRLIQEGIGLVVAHTNLDKSAAGPNHALAEALDVEIQGWLQPQPRQDQVKLVVFTPAGCERKIIEAIGAGGGGVIGAYSHCSFRAPGVGTFLPLEGAKPFLGQRGRFEEAEETRLESVVPKRCLAAVLRGVLSAHPYEEPAYDVYPLEPGLPKAGLGLVGRLRKPVALGRLRARALSRLRPMLPEAARAAWRRVELSGDPQRRIERVAICSGSGGSLVGAAVEAEADCLVAGEIGYHDAVEARSLGLAILALGHFASEAAGMGRFAAALAEEADRAFGKRPGARRAIEFLIAQSEKDPMRLV